ncbi:MAG: RNA-binding transcriptional accessory protein [Bacteroidetes bacterium]|nr:RNA-binding transcriptional accessory protein [Bacteroidota bacterium]
MEVLTAYARLIAGEMGLEYQHVRNTLSLLADGATIPFVARYRKELTGSMNEELIAQVQRRWLQLVALDKRRQTVMQSIEEQGKMTDELRTLIEKAGSMQELEDLYLPYKPKRRTRAGIAREKGLEPLADFILKQGFRPSADEARRYVNASKGVADEAEALAGARDIIAERVSEDRLVRERVRGIYLRHAMLISKVVQGKEAEGRTYLTYYDWKEPLAKAPSHRLLAILRGEAEGFLKVSVEVDNDRTIEMINRMYVRGRGEASQQVEKAVSDSFKRLIAPSMETEMREHFKQKADEVAIRVFAENLRQLLLMPPLGQKRVLAIDPGFRTGCKIVILNEQGQLLHNDTIYPHPPNHEVKEAEKKLRSLVNAYKVEVVAVGNGTAGRETEMFIRHIRFDRDVMAVMVNESGASVYSASKVAREEFPDYDVTVRGAVSIGRRLMDPLAELVKIDPKSIGVGQYQHDVDQKALAESLNQTVELCVNAVGVELNTASEQLLSYVSGIGPQLAANIVRYRNENGPFSNRQQLQQVPRLGPKAFEQCAGFLRIRNGDHPLDASAVHPESYHIVERMAEAVGMELKEMIGRKDLRQIINISDFVDDKAGVETLTDILAELEKPGRDPRMQFEEFEFSKDVRTIQDVQPGMELNGIVTNITAFGAFVDIGVHQDGLVHVSQMADRYVRDPNQVVKINQKVRVRVLSVDLERNRINLSMKL